MAEYGVNPFALEDGGKFNDCLDPPQTQPHIFISGAQASSPYTPHLSLHADESFHGNTKSTTQSPLPATHL